MTRLQKFLSGDDGAVTVDWVVLTAAIVGLGVVVLYPIAYNTENMSKSTATYITGVSVGYQSQ